MLNFDMQIRQISRRRRGQSHIVAICILLTLTLLQELEGKSTTISQKKPLQQQYFQQQQKQQNKNPYGNIFGSTSSASASSSTVKVTTIRPNSIPSVKPMKSTKHPQLQPPEDNVVDRYDIRYPDGSYEFRYELADGTARYERGYFVRLDKVKKSLVVVGYYAYRLSDGRYLTVFYNADQFGYRQNQSITPETYPNLPRSIDVPQLKDEPEEYSASDSNHIGGTQGNHF